MKHALTFTFLLMIFLGTSCTKLDLKEIKCTNDSECPSDTICNFNNRCRACPSNTAKLGNTCLCANTDETFNKTNFTCEKVTDACHNTCKTNQICSELSCVDCPIDSRKEENTCVCNDTNKYYNHFSRNCEPRSCITHEDCQNAYGYCLNNTCHPDSCIKSADCFNDEQCILTESSMNQDGTFYPLQKCEKIGSSERNTPCTSTQPCMEGLSCIKTGYDDERTCQKFQTEEVPCLPTEQPIPYFLFHQHLNKEYFDSLNLFLNICLDRESCIFPKPTPNSSAIYSRNQSCNNYRGICTRSNTNSILGSCIPDECDPTKDTEGATNSPCPTGEYCQLTDEYFYRCQEKSPFNTEICNTNSQCPKNHFCLSSGNNQDEETKVCTPICLPDFIYHLNFCGEGLSCIDSFDSDNTFPPENIDKQTLGYCSDPNYSPCYFDTNIETALITRTNDCTGTCVRSDANTLEGICFKDENCILGESCNDNTGICSLGTNYNISCEAESTGLELGADCTSNICKSSLLCTALDGTKKICSQPCDLKNSSDECDSKETCIAVNEDDISPHDSIDNNVIGVCVFSSD